MNQNYLKTKTYWARLRDYRRLSINAPSGIVTMVNTVLRRLYLERGYAIKIQIKDFMVLEFKASY